MEGWSHTELHTIIWLKISKKVETVKAKRNVGRRTSTYFVAITVSAFFTTKTNPFQPRHSVETGFTKSIGFWISSP